MHGLSDTLSSYLRGSIPLSGAMHNGVQIIHKPIYNMLQAKFTGNIDMFKNPVFKEIMELYLQYSNISPDELYGWTRVLYLGTEVQRVTTEHPDWTYSLSYVNRHETITIYHKDKPTLIVRENGKTFTAPEKF